MYPLTFPADVEAIGAGTGDCESACTAQIAHMRKSDAATREKYHGCSRRCFFVDCGTLIVNV